jgi:hypothetical protein
VLLAAEMRKLVMRDEDYYGDAESGEGHPDSGDPGVPEAEGRDV